MEKQRTIEKETSIEGVGLHTGQKVKLTFKPALDNHGIVFQRVDLEGQPKVQAIADNVTEVERGTTIEKKEAKVNTIEHVMASLVSLKIDNCLIELNGQEVPIMDGSSKPFVELLKAAGVKFLNEDRKVYKVKETIVYRDEARGVELMVVPDDSYSVTAMIDYNSPVLGAQHATLDKIEDFEDHIASVNTILDEINCADKPTLMVFNKIDAYTYETIDEDDLVTEKSAEHYSLEDWQKKFKSNRKTSLEALKNYYGVKEFSDLL